MWSMNTINVSFTENAIQLSNIYSIVLYTAFTLTHLGQLYLNQVKFSQSNPLDSLDVQLEGSIP